MPDVAQHLFGVKSYFGDRTHSYPSPPATLPGPSSGAGEGWE